MTTTTLKPQERYSLLVKTDSYTGNTDSIICGVLTGQDDDRYLGKESSEKYLEILTKAGWSEESIWDLGIWTCRSVDEYGLIPYQINNEFNDGYNTLELFISDEFDEEHIRKVIGCIQDVFGNTIEMDSKFSQNGKVTINILGYFLKREITTSEIEEL